MDLIILQFPVIGREYPLIIQQRAEKQKKRNHLLRQTITPLNDQGTAPLTGTVPFY